MEGDARSGSRTRRGNESVRTITMVGTVALVVIVMVIAMEVSESVLAVAVSGVITATVGGVGKLLLDRYLLGTGKDLSD